MFFKRDARAAAEERQAYENYVKQHNEASAQAADNIAFQNLVNNPPAIPEETIRKIAGIPPKPARPGDSEPRSFVGNTLGKLNAVKDNYSTERDLLAKDIAKLVEEHRQVLLALEAVAKAIEHLDNSPASQMELELSEATAEALRLMGDDATE